MGKKGAIWVSAVIYVMIAVIVMVIVLETGLPLIKSMSERSAFNKIRETLVNLDSQIIQIASEGQGSQRVVPVEVFDGEVKFEEQKVRWRLETKNRLVEQNSRVELGNVVIASDVDVDARVEENFFIVENSLIRINFSRIGSVESYADINTSRIINNIYFKGSNAKSNGSFTFFVNNSNSITGNGYTNLENTGIGLTSAAVRAHVNNSAMSYDIVLRLDSKADFFRASIENYNKK